MFVCFRCGEPVVAVGEMVSSEELYAELDPNGNVTPEVRSRGVGEYHAQSVEGMTRVECGCLECPYTLINDKAVLLIVAAAGEDCPVCGGTIVADGEVRHTGVVLLHNGYDFDSGDFEMNGPPYCTSCGAVFEIEWCDPTS